MMHLPGQRYRSSYRRGQRALQIDSAWLLIAIALLAIVALEVTR